MTYLSIAALDVLAERKRQIDVEGWMPEHDDEHRNGEMTRAAVNYAGAAALCMILQSSRYDAETEPPLDNMGHPLAWPFSLAWWKPGLVRRMLVKAAALIIAEIERLDRAAAKVEAEVAQ